MTENVRGVSAHAANTISASLLGFHWAHRQLPGLEAIQRILVQQFRFVRQTFSGRVRSLYESTFLLAGVFLHRIRLIRAGSSICRDVFSRYNNGLDAFYVRVGYTN